MSGCRRILFVHPRAGRYAALLGEVRGVDILPLETEDEAQAQIGDADALVSIGRWLTPELVQRASSLSWFQCLITGTDHLDVLRRARPSLIVTNARGIHGPQMTELAMLHVLSLSRGGRRLARMQEMRDCSRFLPVTLRGRTVCVVGVGHVAEHFAPVAAAFGLRVTGVTSRTAVPGFDCLYPFAQLHRALSEARFVVAFVPLRGDTRRLFDRAAFAAMPEGAFFVNMARGGIVDHEALADALTSGHLAGAALDALDPFPLPRDNPLWDIETLLISPMIGGQSDRYEEDLAPVLAHNIAAFRDGDLARMRNVVR